MKINAVKIRNLIIICFLTVFAVLCFWQRADWEFDPSGMGCALSSMAAGRYNLDMSGRMFGLVQWVNTVDEPDLLDAPGHGGYDAAVNIYSNPETYGGKYIEYTSQPGFHGWIYFFMGKYIPAPGFISIMGTCILLSIVLALICCEFYKKYGFIFSAAFYIVTVSSQWVANFALDLFYVPFTWFLPMLLGLYCLNNFDKRRLLYPFFFLAVLIKSLCIYEYLPVVMLASVMFLIVELIMSFKKDKQYSRQLFTTIIIIGLVELLAVAVAFTAHSYLRGGGNIPIGMETIFNEDILRRTYGGEMLYQETRHAGIIEASVFDVLAKYLWTGFTGKLALIMSVTVLSISVYKTIKHKVLNVDFWLFVISFITCISWFVLAKISSYIHTHYDMVMWYMSYMQICFYIVIKTLMTKIFLYYDFDKFREASVGLVERVFDKMRSEVHAVVK